MEKEYRELYAESFPLAHAERGGDDTLYLTLTIPHEKRPKKVYMTKSGYWYFRERGEGGAYSPGASISICSKAFDLYGTLSRGLLHLSSGYRRLLRLTGGREKKHGKYI